MYQKLFETVKRITGHQCLETEMQEIIDSVSKQNNRDLLIEFLMDVEECYGMHIQANAEECVDQYLNNFDNTEIDILK